MQELIVDRPRKSSRVTFALENNTVHPISKSKSEDKRSLWYSKVERNGFKKNAIQDAIFFRQLKNSNEEIDSSLYEDRVCAWGLENAICPTTASIKVMIRNGVRKSVLSMQEIQDCNGSSDKNLIAFMSSDSSRLLQDQSHKIGMYYENEVRKMRGGLWK